MNKMSYKMLYYIQYRCSSKLASIFPEIQFDCFVLAGVRDAAGRYIINLVLNS